MRATTAYSDYRQLGIVVSQMRREREAAPSKRGAVTPSADAVVVHVRAGDVMDLPANLPGVGGNFRGVLRAEDVLAGRGPGTMAHYVYPLSFYTQLIPTLPPHVKLCYICAGAQFRSDHGWPVSTAYVNGVRDLFVSRGYSVQVRAGRNPDDDLIFMGSSRHFVRGGGGFSALVAGLVEENGGQVHWERHPGSGIW